VLDSSILWGVILGPDFLPVDLIQDNLRYCPQQWQWGESECSIGPLWATYFVDFIRKGFWCYFEKFLYKNACSHTATATQDLIETFVWEQFDPPYNPDLAPRDFHVFLHSKTFLGGHVSKTTRSKKPLTHGLHRRKYHSTMQGYKHWCPATTSASQMVENMSKSNVRYVHQMAI
jgi:hypothetical protein